MCNYDDLIKLQKRRKHLFRVGNKKRSLTYMNRLYNKKDKSISIQILEKYVRDKDRFNLCGVNKKSIVLNKNTIDFIDKNNLKITCDKII